MGNSGSAPTALQTCLNNVCGVRFDCVGYPQNNPLFPVVWARPFNLDAPVTPIAVVRPKSAEEVAAFVTCAADNGVKVQARSGGHSYANFGLGGADNALAIDLQNLQQFSMDESTWQATIGAGHRLHDVTKKLHDNGGRAMSHGTCPGVGIGGHATIGGLGPSSRMWGPLLDHVLEVEVVTADGKIQRANDTHNSDLFFALKGAGAGFGIITEFVTKTHPEPGSVIEYTYSHSFGSSSEMAFVFRKWQSLISNPTLDRRFGSEFVLHPLGAVVTGTFYGTEEEWQATGIPAKFPAGNVTFKTMDFLASVEQQAQESALWLSELSVAFVAKSLAFREQDLLSDDAIGKLFEYIQKANKGTPLWFLIFDVTGGAINDVPLNATSYLHRDKIMFAQGYGIGGLSVNQNTRDFLGGIIDTIRANVPTGNELTTYAGYVDRDLKNPQEQYWGSNLPTLEHIKTAWDPNDVFHNPQSVRPAKS